MKTTQTLMTKPKSKTLTRIHIAPKLASNSTTNFYRAGRSAPKLARCRLCVMRINTTHIKRKFTEIKPSPTLISSFVIIYWSNSILLHWHRRWHGAIWSCSPSNLIISYCLPELLICESNCNLLWSFLFETNPT